MSNKKALFVFGTRPEAIKMCPIIYAFREHTEVEPIVCLTGQHRELLHQVMDFFQIKSDYDLELMTDNQTLCQLTARAITGLDKVVDEVSPDLVIVQGDTTSAFVGSYVGFLKGISVVHIEAGLRTGNKKEPFPEEANRRLIGQLADLHLCPTDVAVENLRRESTTAGVHLAGNTVIDALNRGLKILGNDWQPERGDLVAYKQSANKVLITLHRRETFGNELEGLLSALQRLAEKYPDTQFLFPVHPNPNVRRPVEEVLGETVNFSLIDPLDYPHFLWAMSEATVILTDSGGVQEEAPTLGIPLLVARKVTERQEGVDAGVAELVGTDEEVVFGAVSKILDAPFRHELPNPYGDGEAATRIVEICEEYILKK